MRCLEPLGARRHQEQPVPRAGDARDDIRAVRAQDTQARARARAPLAQGALEPGREQPPAVR